MVLGALGYSYSISTVASSFGHTAYGRLAFQDRLHNMEFYLKVCKYISYIANCSRWKWFAVVNLNYNSLKNICSCMIVLYGQTLLHRNFIAISLEFLNHACAGRRPARAWFLEIVSVRTSVCVCVCPQGY